MDPTQKSDILIKRFGQIAIYEGLSYLVLLCIAMPLKYWAEYPAGVRWVGSIHGLLFVLYVLLLFLCWRKYKWTIQRVALFLFASIIPFATFWVDKKIKQQSIS